MSPQVGVYTEIDADADIATHAAVLDAHTYNILQKLRTGEYILPYPIENYANVALVADTIYAMPFVVARSLTIDRLAIEMTTGDSGKIARLGIYADGTNLYPGALTKDYGTVSVTDAVIVAASADQALTKGLYWLVLVSDGAPTLRWFYPTTSVLGQYPTSFVSEWCNALWSKANVGSGALASSFPADAALARTRGPAVLPRLKSLD